MPLINESQAFRDAMAYFTNRGMVTEHKVIIHPVVLDAIIEGENAKTEYLQEHGIERSARIMGKVFTSVPHELQIVDVEYQKQVEFARTAATIATSGPEGDKVLEAIDKAFDLQPPDFSKVEEALQEFLDSMASDSEADTLTIEAIKEDAAERAMRSSCIDIEYSVPMNVTGEEQLQDLRMSFASRSVFAGGRNYPLDPAVNLIRPTTYDLAGRVLDHLPLLNLPMFCPFVCVVLTRDEHRVALSSFNLIREAMFLWVAHAIEITNVPINTESMEKDQAKALKIYKKTVKSVTKLMQPFAETFRASFNAFEGEFEDNAKEFYQLVYNFTVGITYYMWECVIGMYAFSDGGGMHRVLGLLANIMASSAHFTEQELHTMQDHHSGILNLHACEESQEDDTLVRDKFPDLFSVQGPDEVKLESAPLIQDDVDAFLIYSMNTNAAVAPAIPKTTMGQLRDLWLYSKDLVAAKQPIWLDAFSDVMGKID